MAYQAIGGDRIRFRTNKFTETSGQMDRKMDHVCAKPDFNDWYETVKISITGISRTDIEILNIAEDFGHKDFRNIFEFWEKNREVPIPG